MYFFKKTVKHFQIVEKHATTIVHSKIKSQLILSPL